jgi:hypothetical protein
MEVAAAFVVMMAVYLMGLLAEEQWKVFTRLTNMIYDGLLACWCMMMRHTGNPIYRYKGRRFR